MKRSTGFRNRVLATESAREALNNTVIVVYAGPVPATADAALGSAVELVTITVDGDGTTPLTMDSTATNAQLSKNPSEVWSGTITTSGTATFYRQQTLADAGDASTTAVRIQGTVGTVIGELNFSDVAFVSGDERRINYYVVAITAG